MPDASGRFLGISVPRVPWLEKEAGAGEHGSTQADPGDGGSPEGTDDGTEEQERPA